MGNRVCLTCGTAAEERNDEFIVLYTYCDTCGEKQTFGTEGEYEARQ